MMSAFVGRDPAAASELARRFDEAASNLEAHAQTVARLLAQGGASSRAPAEMQEVASWARYRSSDLRRRIADITAAAEGRSGIQLRGFLFADRGDARSAGGDNGKNVGDLLRSSDQKKLDATLGDLRRYGSDPAYAAAFFKRLGPSRTCALLMKTARRDSAAIVGDALVLARRTGGITVKFIDGIIAAARKAAIALQAYTGAVPQELRVQNAQDEYVRRGGSQHPALFKYLEAIEPLTPYLEAGAKVAVIGGAVAIVTSGGVGVFGGGTAGVGLAVEVLAGSGPVDAVALQEFEAGFSGASAEVIQADEIVGSADVDQLAAAGGQSNFMAGGEKFAEYAARAKPLEGYHDVIVHGTPGDFGATADAWSTGTEFSHRTLAALIESDPGYRGGPIRLLACDTGGVGATAAQDLANKLGVEVLAPTDTLWAYPSGNLVVGPTPTTPAGGWQAFFPGGPR